MKPLRREWHRFVIPYFQFKWCLFTDRCKISLKPWEMSNNFCPCNIWVQEKRPSVRRRQSQAFGMSLNFTQIWKKQCRKIQAFCRSGGNNLGHGSGTIESIERACLSISEGILKSLQALSALASADGASNPSITDWECCLQLKRLLATLKTDSLKKRGGVPNARKW